MARFRPHLIFASVMLLYFLVRYLRVNIDDPSLFLRFYLTDLLFVPAMGLFSLIVVRFLKRDPSIRVSPALVFLQVALVSIYFEWYLPTYHGKPGWYTSDLLDIGMYVIGGGIFILIQRRL